ncbi:hypothetical protein ACIPSE_45120 [Streptomyces sp. NPDC090106]|uniref:hypothetical protein n=1 Tax=Streptomyces sp. NPDC090106 TaxID=3365946 RepID=UPI0037F37EB3
MTSHNSRSVFRLIAAEQAQHADTETEGGHAHLAHLHAELGLVYIEFETADPSHPHVTKAWCAAEAARTDLSEGTAITAASAIARARLHLALAQLGRAITTP